MLGKLASTVSCQAGCTHRKCIRFVCRHFILQLWRFQPAWALCGPLRWPVPHLRSKGWRNRRMLGTRGVERVSHPRSGRPRVQNHNLWRTALLRIDAQRPRRLLGRFVGALCAVAAGVDMWGVANLLPAG